MKRITALLGLLLFACAVWADEPISRHVIVISVDGLRADALRGADAPRIKEALTDGAFTWRAQTTRPSVTLPSHTSMLSGVTPDKHHVLSNHWYLPQPVLPTPTVFTYAHAAGYRTAMFVGKAKFIHLADPRAVDHFEYPGASPRDSDLVAWFDFKVHTRQWPWGDAADSITVARAAAHYIAARKPNLLFVHLTDPDVVGHTVGWMSDAQMFSIHRTDIAVGILKDEVRRWPELVDTIFILSADHGGHRLTHGSTRAVDMTIPWLSWGGRVVHGHEIEQPILTCDTAATTLHILGLPIPSGLDGHLVREIFVSAPKPTTVAANWRAR